MSNTDYNIKKKELILKLLEKLYGIWDLAGGIYVLVKDTDPDDEMLDGLLDIMQKSISNVKDESKRKIFQDSIDILQKMKEEEEQDRIETLKELEKLIDMLDEVF